MALPTHAENTQNFCKEDYGKSHGEGQAKKLELNLDLDVLHWFPICQSCLPPLSPLLLPLHFKTSSLATGRELFLVHGASETVGCRSLSDVRPLQGEDARQLPLLSLCWPEG